MTLPNSYDVGDKPRLRTNPVFKNDAGVATDPTTVTFRIRIGSGTPTVYVYGTNAQLVKAGTGDYYVDWTIAAEGRHHYRFEGTGAVIAAAEQSFNVRNSAFY